MRCTAKLAFFCRTAQERAITTLASERPRVTQTPRLALLSSGVSPHNDNHARILRALNDDGWDICVFEHSELCMLEAGVCAGSTSLADFDLVWMLGLGEQHDFLDRCQILANLPAGQLVNSALAMLSLHAKHPALPHSPLTFSGNNPSTLLEAVKRHSNITRWVVKPSAGSYGRGVTQTDDLDALTQQLEKATADGRYCLVQAFVQEIAAGETRSLVVNGTIIGSYLRVPDHDFLANLSQGGRAKKTILDTQQTQQVKEIAAALAERGVRFAAIDMAFPWLIEVNIANPGGLATVASLEGAVQPDVTMRLARALRTLLG